MAVKLLFSNTEELPPLFRTNTAFHKSDTPGLVEKDLTVNERAIKCTVELAPCTTQGTLSDNDVAVAFVELAYQHWEDEVALWEGKVTQQKAEQPLLVPFLVGPVPPRRRHRHGRDETPRVCPPFEPLVVLSEDPAERLKQVNDALDRSVELFVQRQDGLFKTYVKGKVKKKCRIV